MAVHAARQLRLKSEGGDASSTHDVHHDVAVSTSTATQDSEMPYKRSRSRKQDDEDDFMTMDQINQKVAPVVSTHVDIVQNEKSVDTNVVTKGRGRKRDDDEDDFMTMDQINAMRITGDATFSGDTADMNSKGSLLLSSLIGPFFVLLDPYFTSPINFIEYHSKYTRRILMLQCAQCCRASYNMHFHSNLTNRAPGFRRPTREPRAAFLPARLQHHASRNIISP